MEKTGQEIELRIRKLYVQQWLDAGLKSAPDNLRSQFIETEGNWIIRALLNLATKDEPYFEYPDGWWQHFKEDCFPKWLKRKFPVRKNWIEAIWKFPEINIPPEFLGKRFVHFEVMKLLEEK